MAGTPLRSSTGSIGQLVSPPHCKCDASAVEVRFLLLPLGKATSLPRAHRVLIIGHGHRVPLTYVQVVELAYTLDSESSAFGIGGSSHSAASRTAASRRILRTNSNSD